MKKSEILLLFFSLTLLVTLLIAIILFYTKPSKPKIAIVENEDEIQLQNSKQNEDKNDWISKIVEKNKDFEYPKVIYYIEF